MTTEVSNERKAWPLGGYAPGNYSCSCLGCGAEFVGDKRSVQCLDCAIIWANKTISAQQRRSSVVTEGMVASLTGDLFNQLSLTRYGFALHDVKKFARDALSRALTAALSSQSQMDGVLTEQEVKTQWQKAMQDRRINRDLPSFSLPTSVLPDYRIGGGHTLVPDGVAQECIRQDCDCFDTWNCSRPSVTPSAGDSRDVVRQTPESYSGRFVGMTPHSQGQWVAYKDHLASLEAVERERDDLERIRSLMARDWFDFCEAMEVNFDTHDAVAYDLKIRTTTAEAQVAALTAERDELAARPKVFCAMLSTGVCDLPEQVEALTKQVGELKGALEWRTMENAPLDGKHCILAVPEPSGFVYNVQGAYQHGQWNAAHRDNVQPIYWMPNIRLPEDWMEVKARRILGGEGQ